MSGGKETPRQKMIGMMYLVLTALLAMNVSKQILHGYIVVNESMEASKKSLTANNKRITESFENTINGNPAAKPYFDKAKQAQALLAETVKYIDQVKFNVIAKTEKYENPKSGDTAQLKYLESSGSIDNYDIPSHELIGSDAATPESGPLTAMELQDKLMKLHNSLIAMLDEMQKDKKTKILDDDYQGLKKKIGSIKPVASGAKDDGLEMTWGVENFYHLPMAAVVTNLNKMQAELKNVEAEMLQVLSGASGKLAIKFDRLSAKVIAPSSYIQSGQPYTADIFLAASSTAMTADMMEVLLGADSASASGGDKVPIEGGMGKYTVNTGGQGEQTYKGVIKFKKPDGTFDRYPFQGTYMVAAPAVAVAAEKMNVIYIGVDNPVSVSAAGVSPTDLLVNISGCGATKTGGAGGKFVFRATTPGTMQVSVSAKTKDGTKPQGKPTPFRVKKIPDPTPKLGGRLVQGICDYRKIELAAIAGVGAEVPGFDFDVKFPVQTFVFSANVKGNLKEFTCNGPNLSPEAKAVLQSLGVGGKAYFEDIKVKAPDGTIRKIATASLKVKN
ncbi:MAG TPA: gliding motility protein GldM [Bacteroidia bacterium]|jgi:gliding motility-associated protein GldM|nr:gliding motility protein GldM [Bacteroidia bacterium]